MKKILSIVVTALVEKVIGKLLETKKEDGDGDK